MKKILTSVIVLLITISVSWSQEQCKKEVFEKIHAAKIVFITDSVKLTADQSEKFFPVYSEYEKEVWATRMTFYKKYKNANTTTASNGASLQYIDDNLDYQEQVIEIKRKYNDRFLKIITPQQLTRLYKAERDFKMILMKRYWKQHNSTAGSTEVTKSTGY